MLRASSGLAPKTRPVKLLAVDTSSDACSCALWIDEDCREIFEMAPQRHGERLLPMMDRLLADAGLSVGQLDALAFGRGPGSFTGVRIAAGAVQGIAFAADLPVAPVSSLRAMAQGVYRVLAKGAVLAAFDARMGEVYWGAYRADGTPLVAPLGREAVCAPDAVAVPPVGTWFGAGRGWGAYRDTLTAAAGDRLAGVDPERYPHAWDVATLGAAAAAQGALVGAEQALPVYLRDKVA